MLLGAPGIAIDGKFYGADDSITTHTPRPRSAGLRTVQQKTLQTPDFDGILHRVLNHPIRPNKENMLKNKTCPNKDRSRYTNGKAV